MSDNEHTSTTMKREAEVQKDLGNKHFKSGDIGRSIDCYSNAIRLDATNPIFFCNRAMAYLKNGRSLEAERDCNSALSLEENCIKALYRRGMARKQLFRYRMALDDFKLVLSLEDNKEAKRELESIQKLIDSKALIDIKPIEKSTEFQSTKPLIKIPIIDKLSQIKVKLPEKVPQNYFQFECDWRQLDDKDCRHLRPKYLKMIGCQRIHTILTSTLEPQMMSSLLEAMTQLDDPLLIQAILKQISTLPRFTTLVLFMSSEEKQILEFIFDKLKANNLDEKLLKEMQTLYLA